MATNMNKFLEAFAFILSQEILKSGFVPRDTNRMAQSFQLTQSVDFSKGKITFNTPFYTKYVHQGTRKMMARPFLIQILNQKGEEMVKKAFSIANS